MRLSPLRQVLQQAHQFQQVLHAEIATSGRNRHKRIRRRKIGKCLWNTDKAPAGVIKADPLAVGGPKIALQFEALSEERMERMSNSKTLGLCGHIRCS